MRRIGPDTAGNVAQVAEQAGAQAFEHELDGQRRQNHAQQPVDDVGAGLTQQFHQLGGEQQAQQG